MFDDLEARRVARRKAEREIMAYDCRWWGLSLVGCWGVCAFCDESIRFLEPVYVVEIDLSEEDCG